MCLGLSEVNKALLPRLNSLLRYRYKHGRGSACPSGTRWRWQRGDASPVGCDGGEVSHEQCDCTMPRGASPSGYASPYHKKTWIQKEKKIILNPLQPELYFCPGPLAREELNPLPIPFSLSACQPRNSGVIICLVFTVHWLLFLLLDEFKRSTTGGGKNKHDVSILILCLCLCLWTLSQLALLPYISLWRFHSSYRERLLIIWESFRLLSTSIIAHHCPPACRHMNPGLERERLSHPNLRLFARRW